MKITLITQYYKPETGAPQNRLLEMCLGLKQEGADISIITGMPNHPTGQIFPEYKGRCFMKEVLDDIEVRRYWLYASNARKALPRIWNMISFSLSVLCSLRYLCKRKNDFIIACSPPLTLGISAWILARLTGAKLISNISDLWPLSARELGAINGDSLVYKVLEKVEHFIYKHSDLCVGQSQQIVDYIASHGSRDTYLFRNGVDPTRFDNVTVHVPKKGEPLQIVYAGLLGYAQGIADICANVPFKDLNAEFHIYGAGGEQNAIEEYVSAHPDRGVIYHGKVTREQIPQVLSQADCTLVPLVKLIYGAVPSKIYESMACGLPILFFGDGEGADIVNTNNIGWVIPSRKYEQLIATIKQISVTNDDYKIKREQCRYCASTLFNRPKQVKYLFNKLQSIL